MENEKDAKIIIIPNLVQFNIFCDRCNVPGQFITYKRYLNEVMRVKFYCNTCCTLMPNNVNMDLTDAPTLLDRPFAPDNLILWARHPSSPNQLA